MRYEELAKIIFNEIKPKLENHQGLSIFARERAKFEGWLKAELCDSLSKYFRDVAPEIHKIDVTFHNWAIELKTINTNYRYKNVEIKTRPITKNIQGVIDDIETLKSSDYENMAVLFVVFPVTHENEDWQYHLEKISFSLRDLRHASFNFKNFIPGVIYFGLV